MIDTNYGTSDFDLPELEFSISDLARDSLESVNDATESDLDFLNDTGTETETNRQTASTFFRRPALKEVTHINFDDVHINFDDVHINLDDEHINFDQ